MAWTRFNSVTPLPGVDEKTTCVRDRLTVNALRYMPRDWSAIDALRTSLIVASRKVRLFVLSITLEKKRNIDQKQQI